VPFPPGFGEPHAVRDRVAAIAVEAGRAILPFDPGRGGTVSSTLKADRSPLTAADQASHELILARLQQAWPAIPVVSEEGGHDGPAPDLFWLVDPLDGTKEFIAGNGQYTVNVGLVRDGAPVLGVVHVPSQGVTYAGIVGDGAWKQAGSAAWAPIRCAPLRAGQPCRVVASRSHPSPALATFLQRVEGLGHAVERLDMGSSLKLCLVADGSAHVYPRLGPTMPWDTCAAQGVVVAAGGMVTDLRGHPLSCAKPRELNPFFLCGSPGTPWAKLAEGLETKATDSGASQ
jgi:3'(2'), 5'-bisphosphate nucleotidase